MEAYILILTLQVGDYGYSSGGIAMQEFGGKRICEEVGRTWAAKKYWRSYLCVRKHRPKKKVK